jgi:hypothetical protein
MSEIKVNKISPRTACGTTTLGDNGDTFNLPSGTTLTVASGATITNNGTQTGFGRSGAVDWQTSSIKTSTFTAANGEGYFCNTTSGGFTVNLPAGSAGAIVSFSDYTRTFGSNNLTITPNGSEKIGGVAASVYLNVNGQAITLVYVDATEGWINIQNAEDTETGVVPAYITATGGTITTVCTNYKVHTFTGPGTFTVCSVGNAAGSNEVSYVVVAGGAGTGSRWHAGGGGAGGYREGRTSQCNTWTASPLNAPAGLPVSAQGYPIVVGAGGSDGGAPGNNPAPGGGNNSSFSTITSAGGGKGGTFNEAGGNGGSGGGGGSAPGSPMGGGTGNTPPVSPPQGTNGGAGAYPSGGGSGGGGGGATQAGSASPNTSTAGDGGDGATSSINGTPTARAGGGAGAQSPCGTAGTGGTGGGANPGSSGTANTGGGGGGPSSPQGTQAPGSSGGSGIVLIRYRFQ